MDLVAVWCWWSLANCPSPIVWPLFRGCPQGVMCGPGRNCPWLIPSTRQWITSQPKPEGNMHRKPLEFAPPPLLQKGGGGEKRGRIRKKSPAQVQGVEDRYPSPQQSFPAFQNEKYISYFHINDLMANSYTILSQIFIFCTYSNGNTRNKRLSSP